MYKRAFVSTRNPCKLCSPLGASLVFKGIQGCVGMIHGSQGCSTYIRRYFINHFKEPVDIASSNFSENTAVFGGGDNLKSALTNIIEQYDPEMIGIATTCLSETIGDDVSMILKDFQKERDGKKTPVFIHVSTPSYRGTHMDGYHEAVRAIVQRYAVSSERNGSVAVFPGFVSPEDIRHLKEVFSRFGLKTIFLPDYSDTLDGGLWDGYQHVPRGGTDLKELKELGGSSSVVEFGETLADMQTGASWLEHHCGVERHTLGLPIGIEATDDFFHVLCQISGKCIPSEFKSARERLTDAYCDGHKYVFNKRAAVYGDQDFTFALTKFLWEIGCEPVLCATGAKTGDLQRLINEACPTGTEAPLVMEGVDFMDIQNETEGLKPDFMIGSSKGADLARKINVPLIRVGFPVHDRFGAARMCHLGYRGTQELFDRIVNTLIACEQNQSPVGYSYM